MPALLGVAALALAGIAPDGVPPARCDAAAVVRASGAAAVPLRLVLNIPAYRLEAVEHDRVTVTIRVAVGSPRYPTPIGEYAIDYVEWNPWWRPPDRPWARGERAARPGWSNPVGRVKLHVTGLVFLHGSPLVASLGTAASHACVRLANDDAMLLARLVHRHASPASLAPVLDSLQADTTATRRIALASRVPVSTRYELAEHRGDSILVHPDVYRLAGRRVPAPRASVMRLLAGAGRDTAAVRAPALARLLRDGRTRHAAAPLDSLIPAGAPTP